VRLGPALLALALTAGCLVAQPPAEPRYFSPALPDQSADPPKVGEGTLLRLRRVRAASYLRDRMVWRSGVEIGFNDMLRWTDSPAHFAQAALETELFERRGFRRSNVVGIPNLAVSLEAFDEVLAPAHEGAVRLDVVLSDPKSGTLLDRSFEVRKPIASDDPRQVADALGAALAEATTQVGAAVAEHLTAQPF
jgi:ABC-type uncharacterized transport system auxiliary subunit